jgi:hypothetical protein
MAAHRRLRFNQTQPNGAYRARITLGPLAQASRSNETVHEDCLTITEEEGHG